MYSRVCAHARPAIARAGVRRVHASAVRWSLPSCTPPHAVIPAAALTPEHVPPPSAHASACAHPSTARPADPSAPRATPPTASAGLQAIPANKLQRKPDWLRGDWPRGAEFRRLRASVKSLGLATVCEQARCPNIGECWSGHKGTATATIMLMGDTCTRACRFCAVKKSPRPPPLNPLEPGHVQQAVKQWGLGYVVLTSVDRDDVADGGAAHIAQTVQLLKALPQPPLVECLTPDFAGRQESVALVARSGVDVFAHNVETVARLSPRVRDRRANYTQSLRVLRYAKQVQPRLLTKSSIMLGLGETHDEVEQTLRDLRAHDVDVVTFGQYLRPSKGHMKVVEYIQPATFEAWKQRSEALGFLYVASGPLVRSSYRAGEFYLKHLIQQRTNAVSSSAAASSSSSSSAATAASASFSSFSSSSSSSSSPSASHKVAASQ